MQFKPNKQINYFNEALLLATYTCNLDKADDAHLPIDYDKITVSKSQVEEDYHWLVSFLTLIRAEARALLANHKDIQLLFQKVDDSVPEILYFLTYSKLDQSVENYSPDDLWEKIKRDFQANMLSLGYQISPAFTFEDIDQLTIFNEQQRYMLYKLCRNINRTFDRLYNCLLSLESIIRSREDMVIKELNALYETMTASEMPQMDVSGSLDAILDNHHIEMLNCTFFLQFPQLYGFSLLPDNELEGLLFIGLMPYLLRNHSKSLEENKDDLIRQLAVLADATRFNILVLLSRHSMYGKEISDKLSISTGTISHHLSLLLKEGLILSEMRGKRIYYRPNHLELTRLSHLIKQIGGVEHDQ